MDRGIGLGPEGLELGLDSYALHKLKSSHVCKNANDCCSMYPISYERCLESASKSLDDCINCVVTS